MSDQLLLILASAAAAAGVGTLFFSWKRPSKTPGLTSAGWGLFAAATTLAGMAGGAWGIAIAAMVGMALALGLLLRAALLSPDAKGVQPAKPRNAAKSPLRLGKRLSVFVMVVPAALLASLYLALAAFKLAEWMGAGEANAIALALFVFPLVWMGLAFWVMMAVTLKHRIAILAGSALPAAALIALAMKS